MSPSQPEVRSAPFADATLSVIFLIAIFVPGIATIWYPDKSDKAYNTNRKNLAATFHSGFADFVEDFPKKFRQYINLHFAFRGDLVDLNARATLAAFNESTSKNVVIGEDGWLLYAEYEQLNDFRGLKQLLPDELDLWAVALQRRHDYLAERNIPYLFVVAPNKEIIYPEKVPARFNRITARTRQGSILQELRARNATVEALDLQDSQFKAKRIGRSYLPADTHWNDLGGFYGYRAIITKLKAFFPEMDPMSMDRIQRREVYRSDYDLQKLLGIRRYPTPPAIHFDVKNATAAMPMEKPADAPAFEGLKYGDRFLHSYRLTTASPGKPRAILLRDSFSVSLLPFLAEHFSEVLALWTPFSMALLQNAVEKFHPDVVIEERYDRLLQNTPLYDPVISAKRFAEVFRSAGETRLRLATGEDAKKLKKRGALKVEGVEDGIKIKVNGSNSRVEFPKIFMHTGESMVSRWSIRMSKPGMIRFQWRHKIREQDDKEREVLVEIPAGKSQVYLALPDAAEDGQMFIRLVPEMENGEILISTVEFRATTKPGPRLTYWVEDAYS